MVVAQVFKRLKIEPLRIDLGVVELEAPLTEAQSKYVAKKMVSLGFELLTNQKEAQVEVIRNLLIKVLQEGSLPEHFSVKKYLSAALPKDYSLLSKLFTETAGITIEQYFIRLKVEKAKELITYELYTLQEIARYLGYSSVQHLSSQFKKVSGVSTSTFKRSLFPKRKPFDQVGLL
jgi:AraC-like DNA-binding protein